jgi:chromosome partitioning protein
MKVITVLNQKGGAGKTTIAVNMAARLNIMGHKVVLVDADHTQESAMTWATFNEGRYFEVIDQHAKQIENFVARNTASYDYAIIDCPPRANELTGKFINVSDLILIPVQPSPYDIWACRELIELIQTRQELSRGFGPTKPVAAFVLSRATKRSRIVGETAEVLSDTGFNLLEAMTTQYEVYKRSAMTGHHIFDAPEYNPKAADQIINITNEVLELLNE